MKEGDSEYASTAARMIELASLQPGFLGIESGITVSYWRDLKSISSWKQNIEHQAAQRKGRNDWYSNYKVRISKVERDYGKI